MNQEKFKKFNKAAFLDRDGVINKDIGYLHKINDFSWIEGAKEAISFLKKKQFFVIVITNQSGVERGFFSESDINCLHNWINDELKKTDCAIDDFFYSTELPSNKIVRRKPSPSMINEALIKYNLKKEKCFMIGDKESDIQCAKNAGIKGFLFTGGNLYTKVKKIVEQFDN